MSRIKNNRKKEFFGSWDPVENAKLKLGGMLLSMTCMANRWNVSKNTVKIGKFCANHGDKHGFHGVRDSQTCRILQARNDSAKPNVPPAAAAQAEPSQPAQRRHGQTQLRERVTNWSNCSFCAVKHFDWKFTYDIKHWDSFNINLTSQFVSSGLFSFHCSHLSHLERHLWSYGGRPHSDHSGGPMSL